jgi:hypothetical protein
VVQLSHTKLLIGQFVTSPEQSEARELKHRERCNDHNAESEGLPSPGQNRRASPLMQYYSNMHSLIFISAYIESCEAVKDGSVVPG